MKAYVLISVARQVDGEYCVVKAEKAFLKSESADNFSKNLAKKYAETIQTPAGPIQCVCERGVFEIEIEQ
jgi:hypothetical protein